MEQSKSPKSLAYSRLGKPNNNKISVPEQSVGRKSTCYIYQELLSQFDPKQQKYLRDLVSKNSKEHADSSHFHNRRKSYADLEVQNSNKKQKKQEKPREERQTLTKNKQPQDLVLLQKATPKNKYQTQTTISDFMSRTSFNLESQTNKIPSIIQRESVKISNKSFLDNLTNYVQQLSVFDGHISKWNVGDERLGQTLKFSHGGTENYKYASKIEQQMHKIKQLKLKNHCFEKQMAKRDKRQKKMKSCLYEMLQQIKQLNSELNKEKKQRKRLQKVIENFEMRSQQFERKTIGKNYNLSKIQEFKSKISEFTQNEQEKNDLDSPFRQMWRHSNGGNSKPKHPIYISQGGFDNNRGQLDSTKIQKIFRSNFHSQDEQNDIYQ